MSARLPLIALGLFALGVATLFPFEHTITRIIGVAALFGAIVGGVFAIASPELLEAEDEDESGA